MSGQLAEMERQGADMLAAVKSWFKAAEVTIVARSTPAPDGSQDWVLSTDTLPMVIRALIIRAEVDGQHVQAAGYPREALRRIYAAARALERGEENPREVAQAIQETVLNAMAGKPRFLDKFKPSDEVF